MKATRIAVACGVMALFLALMALALRPGPQVQAQEASQGVIKVPDDYATIQAAVDAAVPGDEIWVATGVYAGVQARNGVTQVVYISKTVTIRGGYNADFSDWDVNSYPTTLDAGGQGRVVYISGSISPTIEGLRITGGMAGYGHGVLGGGVYVVTATTTISNSRIFSNTAALGGGVSLQFSAARLQGNAIATNFADWGGGGLYLQSSPAVIDGNTVSTNTVYSFNFPVFGGGLYLVESTATLGNNIVTANTVEGDSYEGQGGGLYLRSSSARLSGNVISHNGAWGLYATGGGVHLYKSDTAILDGNTIADNGAFFGGGLYLEQSDSMLDGNTVMDNRAYTGGGVALGSSAATLDGNTISGNAARGAYGGGVSLSNSAAMLSGNTVTGNIAELAGGGLYLTNSGATLNNNIISSNVVSSTVEDEEGGGGLYLVGSNATLNGNTIIGNVAEHNGGGLYLRESSDALLVNNVVADNQASMVGSGLCIEWAYPRLLHTTIARNSGGDGSGIYIKGYYTVALTNTILVGHMVGITATASSTVTLEATLWGTDTWANNTDWSGGGAISTGTVNVWGDPMFVLPDAGNYHIGPNSAARDKGVDAGIAVDIDGDARQDPHVDIGADEYSEYALFLPLVSKNY